MKKPKNRLVRSIFVVQAKNQDWLKGLSWRKIIRRPHSTVGLAMLALIIVVAVASIGTTAYTLKYKDKIYPNTVIGSVNFGGKTIEEAEKLLLKEIELLPTEATVTVNNEAKGVIRLKDLSPDFKIRETALSLF